MRLRHICLFVVGFVGCADDEVGSAVRDTLLERGVSIEEVFAPPTEVELASVLNGWEAFRPEVVDFRQEYQSERPNGDRLTVVSHTVQGHRHFGAIIARSGRSGPLPVLVSGIGFGPPFELVLDDAVAAFDGAAITVLPSFRGHTLRIDDREWTSEGTLFDQCDGGTDDLLTLLQAVFDFESRADPDRIIVVGGSRGGNVAMLAGIRDPRVDRVVSLAGPTNYLIEEYIDHPNLFILYRDWFVKGLLDGNGSIGEARARMLACSPGFFVERLPPTQVHHGTADLQVPVESAMELARRRDDQNLDPDRIQVYLYDGDDHALSQSIAVVNGRAQEFLRDLIAP